MHRYVESIKVAMEEIRKALDTLSTKDISSTGISARQVIEKGLNHITKVVEALSREIKSPESSDLARAAAEQPAQKAPQMPQMQQEMTSMGGGNAAGVSGGIDLGSDEENLEEEDEFYLKEGTLPLRKIIREAISALHKDTNLVDFRQLLEQFGMENPPQEAQQANTGGELAREAVFPSIKTIIQKQYTMLKTNNAQRQAFTKQLIKALEGGVNKLQIDFEVQMAGGGTVMQTDLGDKNEEESFFASIDIPGIDETGKGFALTVYNAIFPKIKSALNGEPPQFGLTDPIDRRSFVKTIVDMTRELLSSLEKHMTNSGKPPAPAPAQAVAPKPPAKTNANSDFMLP